MTKYFSDEWIYEGLSSVKTKGNGKMDPITLAQLFGQHPLIDAIYRTQKKLSRAKATGKPILIGESEVLQKVLHHNLAFLENSPHFDSELVARRLKDADEFWDIEYELLIAAAYKHAGYTVEFIPVSEKRTGEFYATKDSQKILIECKRKQRMTRNESLIETWWKEFQHLLLQRLINKEKFYSVVITMPFDPKKEEIRKIADEIQDLILGSIEGTRTSKCGRYSFELKKLASSPEEEVVQSSYEQDDLSFVVSNSSIRPGGKESVFDFNKKVKMPILIGLRCTDDLEGKTKGVLHALKSAYGQLEEGKSNVVYIDIGYLISREKSPLEVVGPIRKAIEKELGLGMSKISAVVLTNNQILKVNGVGWSTWQECIYNARAIHPIPQGLPIPGDTSKYNLFSLMEKIMGEPDEKHY
jgi:hypothetical protein